MKDNSAWEIGTLHNTETSPKRSINQSKEKRQTLKTEYWGIPYVFPS